MISKVRDWSIAGFLVMACGCGAAGEPELEAAPRSLEGTEIDGRFVFDADGELVVDEGVQRTFDYFLTADGELAANELDAWVAEQVRAKLGDGRAHEQVMDAWYAYRMFRAKAAAVLEDPTLVQQPEQVERRLLAALDLHLGDTPLARIERQHIEQGFALQRAYALPDPRARKAALARLSADEAQRFADSRAGRWLAGSKALARARQQQADVATMDALRKQHFDAIEPGAAARLAALVAKRAAWTERVEKYQTACERLRRRFAGREAELFSPTERRRIRAIERMNAAE